MTKKRKLAHEILGLIAISGLAAVVLYAVLTGLAGAAVQEYTFYNDIPMTEFDWMNVDKWIFGCGAVISICCFAVLFLAMLASHIAYIRTITQGIGEVSHQTKPLPLEGNNELTELAGAINAMAAESRALREKEQALAREKDQFVRALSHDIRTPLTSILAYSDYLATTQLPPQEQASHLLLIKKKAQQIKELTDLLLDGGKRNVEQFDDARLLMEQLAEEFAESLEDCFAVSVDLSACTAFAGSFDVQELRRIFDNLSSNVQKYADPAQSVALAVRKDAETLEICQRNAVAKTAAASDSYQLGLRSIQRIAQSYGGNVKVEAGDREFAIFITLHTGES